jgi:hypothetical protein
MAVKERKYYRQSRKVHLSQRSQGDKLRETKEGLKKLAEKFPIGELVTQKYHPDCVGVIAGKPKSDRLSNEYVMYYIDVLWMKNKFFGNGEIHATVCTQLKIYKPKKVV